MSAPGKVVVVTGGTGGIGYQAALAIAKANLANTVIITGRSVGSGNEAVGKIKAESGNANVHLALGDLALQQGVRSLAAELLHRFPKIDVLVNNAGNLCTGTLETTADGVTKNFAVNVIAPLLLSRLLLPALQAASPVGNVQITSGGTPFPEIKLDDLEGAKVPVGVPSYSHSKRVMEAMSLALEKELAPHGIAVNVVGGGSPGSTSMTAAVNIGDLPWFVRCLFPCWMCMMAPDSGKSAALCAKPVVWGVSASPTDLGTRNYYLVKAGKKESWPKPALDEAKQAAVLKYCESKIVKCQSVISK
ncbi:hypothetical protein T484DRAFT_1904201 [Baffinella frigidus]|nr:hypothetical protein T484DRAFT_1904201 [Cryptophyta sp. CCMP2293]